MHPLEYAQWALPVEMLALKRSRIDAAQVSTPTPTLSHAPCARSQITFITKVSRNRLDSAGRSSYIHIPHTFTLIAVIFGTAQASIGGSSHLDIVFRVRPPHKG
jgi:hypothetical protein